MRRYIGISILLGGLGVVVYGIYNDYLILRFPQSTWTGARESARHKRVNIYYWNGQQHVRQQMSVVWEHDHVSNMINQVVALWLNFVKEDDQVPRHIGLESAAVSSGGDRVYLSFSDSPFKRDVSIYAKWQLLESLLHTVRDLAVGIHDVVLLVHHAPLSDEHLECKTPWHIGGFTS